MKQNVDWVRVRAVCTATAGIAVLMSLSGCSTFRNWFSAKKANRGVLLAPRAIVPAPYAEPPEQAGNITPPPEPLPPVVPPAVEKTPAVAPAKEVTPPKVELPPPPKPGKVLTHKVAKGESFWTIARMYGVSMAELAAYNHMNLNDVLRAGKVLRIPPGGQYIPPEKRRNVTGKASGKHGKKRRSGGRARPKKVGKRAKYEPIPPGGKYVVKSGDSLWKIAHRYGLKTADIRRANNLTSDLLQIGQVLILPKPGHGGAAARPSTPAPASAAPKAGMNVGPAAPPAEEAKPAPVQEAPAGAAPGAPKADVGEAAPKIPNILTEYPKRLEHTVMQGDTIQKIAEMYRTDAKAVLKANPQIHSDADLKPGMIVIVPYNE